MKTRCTQTLIFQSLTLSENCLYFVLFIPFSFFQQVGIFWSSLSFVLVLIFSFFFLSKNNKIYFIICFCISPFLHHSMLPVHTRTPKNLDLESSMETLFIIMSCLPSSGGGFVCCCYLFSLNGLSIHSGDYGEKNAKCDNLYKYLCTVEESRGNLMRT